MAASSASMTAWISAPTKRLNPQVMKTAQEETYFDHVMACTKCKIRGRKGRETIEHCDEGEFLHTNASLAGIMRLARERKAAQNPPEATGK